MRRGRCRLATSSPWPVPRAILYFQAIKSSCRNRSRASILQKLANLAWNISSREDSRRVAADLGIFLDRTYRLPDDLCEIISTGIYDGRLKGQRGGSTRHLVLGPNPTEDPRPTGLVFYPVQHEGCTQSSIPEADAIARLVDELLNQKVRRKDFHIIERSDVLVVAPYNMQVDTLRRRLPSGISIGTVGQVPGTAGAGRHSFDDDLPR